MVGLPTAELQEIVRQLVSRPGHERVRVLVRDLLVRGLGLPDEDVRFEDPLREVRGFIDALVGRTVFEFKRDLRREAAQAGEQLQRYLGELEASTRERYVGIATDGATFAPCKLRDGALIALPSFSVALDRPRGLLEWLDGSVAVRSQVEPDPQGVRAALGKDSLAYQVARQELAGAWEQVGEGADVRLKRELWAGLLETVYGSAQDADDLFFQHTYLTIIAKAMAMQIVGVEANTPGELLSGKPFVDRGIVGAVESDFFDWVMKADSGPEIVARTSRQVSRFRLEGVDHDVLKGLYESLIDPEQRHDLGEYYTPDWLAAKMCERTIPQPLEQRILDPSCGSGTFLFHAVRRHLQAADEATLSNLQALENCTEKVRGVDVHPVAAIIARVTYLLAIGEQRLRSDDRPPVLAIPVYLGESLQWRVQAVLGEARQVEIPVPDGPTLYFPFSVTSDPSLFDEIVGTMLDFGTRSVEATDFEGWVQRRGVLDSQDIRQLSQTYEAMRELTEKDRDHIWGYVSRNLSRPMWLSSADQLSDVVIGNPPWLAYRFMNSEMQERFRRECQARSIWAGGRVATHQDLSGYFFARSAELYLRPGGTIAFVMPHAALTRQQFAGLRTGSFHPAGTSVRFTEAWGFDERVTPLFEVPSCVILAEQGTVQQSSMEFTAYAGILPRRDASLTEAEAALIAVREPLPGDVDGESEAPYEDEFHQGATVVPRMLFAVDRVRPGPLGGNPAAPLVASHRSNQEKRPWRAIPSLTQPVETQFLRPLFLGESVVPFRTREPLVAIIPWDPSRNKLLDSNSAQAAGYPHLAAWLEKAERLWAEHGSDALSLLEQLDYYGKLTAQFPAADVRVVYAASGAVPTAAILRDSNAVVE